MDFSKCELIGGGSSRHLNTFSNFFFLIVGCTLHTHQYTLYIAAIGDCTHVHHVLHIRTYHNLVAIGDCTHVHHVLHIRTYHNLVAIGDCTHTIGSATASFEDLVTLHRRTLQ